MTVSISSEQKQELMSALQFMIEHRKCTKQQLLSLIGKLSFACKVVPAGRTFLCRMIDLSCSVSRIHHHIRLTKEVRLDMYWWVNFLPQWSGTSCILETKWTTTISMNLYTDASGTPGCFLPLQPQSTAGAITGVERRCSSTATTSLSVISGAGFLSITRSHDLSLNAVFSCYKI